MSAFTNMVPRLRKAVAAVRQALSLSPVSSRNYWPWIREPWAGAWQQNAEHSVDLQLAFSAVYACTTLISNDFGKMRQLLKERGGMGKVWSETESAAFSPFLRRPNRFQNHIQFKQWWAMSKLTSGNTYALKERDARGVVVAEYILDPKRVLPLVTPDGSVYYQLGTDNLAGIQADMPAVPASEIVHDRMNCLFHPLVGVSPLYAAGLAAAQGLAIQRQSSTFFGNGARPSGILTAPEPISQEDGEVLKTRWEERFTGNNAGKIAVLGGGLTYIPMTMSATDAQVVQQLGWAVENVCMAFHVPPWKIGHGQQPTYNNGELANQQYYDSCLQSLIEEYELCQDQALGIGEGIKIDGRELGIELDLGALLRMDTKSKWEILGKGVKDSLIPINDARFELDMPPVEGGDTIWMQQQYYSLDALQKRDGDDPFAKPEPAPPPAPEGSEEEEEEEGSDDTTEAALALLNMKAPESLSHA